MQERRVAVRGIIIKDNLIFCVKLKKYPGSIQHESVDFWCTPGGGVDIGEPLLQALERELIEETGVKPVVGNLLYIQQFEHKNKEHLEFFFAITNAEDYEQIDLSNTTHGKIEIAEYGFIDPKTHTILPAFLKEVDFSEHFQQPVAVFNNLAE